MFEIQKKITWASIKSGIVITIALFFLFFAIFFSGNFFALFTPKILLNAKISNIQGLREGAPVWLFGTEIGKVSDVKVTTNGVIITLSVDKKYTKQIYKDASATIMTMGILGDKFVEIKQGRKTTQYIAQNDTISGVSSIEFDQVTTAAVSTLTQMDTVVLQLAQLLYSITNSTGSLAQLINDPSLYKQLTTSAENLSKISSNLITSDGTVKMLIEDPELYQNLNNATQQLTNVMNRIDHGFGNGGVASALVNDSSMASNLKETISSLKVTAKSINELVIDFKNNPKKYLSIKIF